MSRNWPEAKSAFLWRSNKIRKIKTVSLRRKNFFCLPTRLIAGCRSPGCRGHVLTSLVLGEPRPARLPCCPAHAHLLIIRLCRSLTMNHHRHCWIEGAGRRCRSMSEVETLLKGCIYLYYHSDCWFKLWLTCLTECDWLLKKLSFVCRKASTRHSKRKNHRQQNRKCLESSWWWLKIEPLYTETFDPF